jgi:NADH-quinone oxidoreductase subunit J
MIGFIILAAVMLAGALGVVTLRQPVHAALSLVLTLLALAVTYVTLEAHFLAVIQVIVYAGAIMVLFLFVIMLLNVQGQQPPPHLSWMRPLAYLAALLAAVGIAITAFVDRSPLPSSGQVAALQGGSAEQVGTLLFSHYVLAFQLVGVLLLTGIVGAVSLAQRGNPAADEDERARSAADGAAPDRELSHG